MSDAGLIREPVEIAVVDYGMGNRRSVEKALAHVGATATVTSDHERLRAADGLVLPGVGAFPKAMENLHRLGLVELIRERTRGGTPLLGICLGMQLAFDCSSELGGAEGLSIVPGHVRVLDTKGLKLPHIGWNQVAFERPSPLLADLPSSCAFYHVHSFVPEPAERQDVLGTGEYGERFVTAVQRENFYGVQFHPEKSSAAGLRLLANFVRVCIAGRVGCRSPVPG
jgi:glutamine amidotransferase